MIHYDSICIQICNERTCRRSQVHRYVSMPVSLLTSSPCVLAMDAIDTRDAREAMADRGSWGPTNNSETETIQANKYIKYIMMRRLKS